MRIAVVGGSGFVGRALSHELRVRGYTPVIVSRRPPPDSASSQDEWRVYQPHLFTDELLDGCACVINLVGILNKRLWHTRDFYLAHVELPKRIVAACRSLAIRRCLHVSALHARPEGPSEYLKTKYAGEALVLEAKHLDATSFCPSVLFGHGDSFLNRFAGLLKQLPIPLFPLACAQTRFAPLYVNELVAHIVDRIDDTRAIGRRITLCGPKQYTLEEIVLYVARLLEKPVKIIALSDTFARLQARFCDCLPGRPFSYDNYLSLQVDSVCTSSDTIGATLMEDIAPQYIQAAMR